jgi:hypothetical protein
MHFVRALFFNRLGELRDRRFENQVFRASGLNLLIAAIILWDSRYLAAAIDSLGSRRQPLSREPGLQLEGKNFCRVGNPGKGVPSRVYGRRLLQ